MNGRLFWLVTLLIIGSCATQPVEYPSTFKFGDQVTPHIIEYSLGGQNTRVAVADRARRTETPYLNALDLKNVVIVNANSGIYARFDIGENADKVAEYKKSGASPKPANDDGLTTSFLFQDLAPKHIGRRTIAGEVCEVWRSKRFNDECITSDGIVLWSSGGTIGTQPKIATKLIRGEPAAEEFLPPEGYELISSDCRKPIVRQKLLGENVTIPPECSPLLNHLEWFLR